MKHSVPQCRMSLLTECPKTLEHLKAREGAEQDLSSMQGTWLQRGRAGPSTAAPVRCTQQYRSWCTKVATLFGGAAEISKKQSFRLCHLFLFDAFAVIVKKAIHAK